MANFKPRITIMLEQLKELNLVLIEPTSSSVGAPKVMEKDIKDLYSDLRRDLSSLYFELERYSKSNRYINEPADSEDRICGELRSLCRIVDPLVRESWNCDGTKMQPHLIWCKVGFIKAKYHLNKLWISLGLENKFMPITRTELDARRWVEQNYSDELVKLEQETASRPEPTTERSFSNVCVQTTEVEFKTPIEYEHKETNCDLGKDELSNINAELNNANAELSNANAELSNASAEIEKLKLDKAERLKQDQNWGDAERAFQEVISLRKSSQGAAAHDDATIQWVGYEVAEMQMNQGKYAEAEDIARGVWEKRKSRPGEEDSDATRCSMLQLCRALRGQKVETKLREAEILYSVIWSGAIDKRWKIKNGHELALVLAEQKRFRAAYTKHQDVWAERVAEFGARAVETVSSLSECLDILAIQENLDPGSTEREDPRIIIIRKQKLLQQIWDAHEGPAAGSFPVFARGHELGSMLFHQGHFDEAVPILNDVWEARKALPEAPAVTLSTGDLLAKALHSCGRLEQAAIVYRWICDTREQDPFEDSQLAKCRQVLGSVLFKLGRFEESATECRKVWEPACDIARTTPWNVPEPALDAGLDLALSLEQLENSWEEASQTIELVCKCKSRQLQPLLLPSAFDDALHRIQQMRQAAMVPELRPPSQPTTPISSRPGTPLVRSRPGTPRQGRSPQNKSGLHERHDHDSRERHGSRGGRRHREQAGTKSFRGMFFSEKK